MPGTIPRSLSSGCVRPGVAARFLPVIRPRLGVPVLLALGFLAAEIAPAAARNAGATGRPASIPSWIQRPDSIPPGTREAVATATWTEGPARPFSSRPGVHWRVVPESAVTGWLVRAGERHPIRQTRLRIEEDRKGRTRILAWLQHTANTEVSFLLPGDPRLTATGPAVDDSLRPWPNPCSLLPYELDHAIDLNRNGRAELAVNSSANLPDPAASRILLVESDDAGRPRIVPLSEVVGTVRFEEGIITSITFRAGSADPVLAGEFLPLYNCRFLARLEIRGQETCRSCCMVSMVLHRDGNGPYRPVFDRPTQSGLLGRLRDDLTLVQEGGPGPLTSGEQVALCRAAAFLYLTGTGRGTRAELVKALGPRALIPQSVQLLGRLDRFFLRDED
jgi:hypothetical protein